MPSPSLATYALVLLALAVVFAKPGVSAPLTTESTRVEYESPAPDPEPTTAPSPVAPTRRTATAVIQEDDGVWGSVVFHQWAPNGPVIISMLFQNMIQPVGGAHSVNYQIRDEPVHYDLFSKDRLCSDEALKNVTVAKEKAVGDLGNRHRRMVGTRFSDVVYDGALSLYEGHDGFIVGKSFVIRLGPDASHHKCATIYASQHHSQRPGAVPCERVHYSDCLLGAIGTLSKCVYKPCHGHRQYWGAVNASTTMCRQVWQLYPKAVDPAPKLEGLVDCQHGQHTLLTPITGEYV